MEWYTLNFQIDIGYSRYLNGSTRIGNPSFEGPISKKEIETLFLAYLREELRPFVTITSIVPDKTKESIYG